MKLTEQNLLNWVNRCSPVNVAENLQLVSKVTNGVMGGRRNISMSYLGVDFGLEGYLPGVTIQGKEVKLENIFCTVRNLRYKEETKEQEVEFLCREFDGQKFFVLAQEKRWFELSEEYPEWVI